jgi:hypothetical protein
MDILVHDYRAGAQPFRRLSACNTIEGEICFRLKPLA